MYMWEEKTRATLWNIPWVKCYVAQSMYHASRYSHAEHLERSNDQTHVICSIFKQKQSKLGPTQFALTGSLCTTYMYCSCGRQKNRCWRRKKKGSIRSTGISCSQNVFKTRYVVYRGRQARTCDRGVISTTLCRLS